MSVTSDLITLFGNHTFAANASLSGEPSVHELQSDVSVFPEYGEIILYSEQRVKRTEVFNRMTETWLVQCDVVYKDSDANNILDALIEEIDACFRTNNASISRDYFITFLYTTFHNRSTSYATGTITVLKEWYAI